MKRLKRAVEKIFFMPYWLTVLIAIPCFLFVAYVLANGLERSGYGAAAYALSSFALIITVTAVYRIAKVIKVKITSHRLWKRYQSDFVFRTKISLIPNILINIIFVLMKLISGFYSHSIWMIALGIYYVFLLLLRVTLLQSVYRDFMMEGRENEIRVTRLYGLYLLLLDIALGGIVLYAIYRGAEYSYPGYLIYAMAAYTFYAVIMASIGYVKNHRNKRPAIVTLNILKLTTALVALFALETAMLDTFGQESSRMFRQNIVAVTGFVILATILGMALYLIIHFQVLNHKKQSERINLKEEA